MPGSVKRWIGNTAGTPTDRMPHGRESGHRTPGPRSARPLASSLRSSAARLRSACRASPPLLRQRRQSPCRGPGGQRAAGPCGGRPAWPVVPPTRHGRPYGASSVCGALRRPAAPRGRAGVIRLLALPLRPAYGGRRACLVGAAPARRSGPGSPPLAAAAAAGCRRRIAVCAPPPPAAWSGPVPSVALPPRGGAGWPRAAPA